MATLGAIKISQGCDYKLIATIVESSGTAKDLTGHTGRFRVSSKDLLGKYVDVGDTQTPVGHGTVTITDAINGIITVALDPHTPLELPTNNPIGEESILQANNLYSLALIDSAGVITKVVQGDCFTEAEL